MAKPGKRKTEADAADQAAKDDLLAEYNARRDFTKTLEPAGKAGRAGSRVFMVQKHDATRLHYDLRLEKDGVLKSWAVTKGPSLDPDDKRLAVQTEDHPLSYATFEGTIPKGEYGGGTVMLWDRGTWAPIKGKSADDLEDGHLHFILDGERMKGEWLLVRMKRRPGEKRDNWLLRKLDDEYSGSSEGLTGKYLTSVDSGRTMDEIAEGKRAGRTGSNRSGGKKPRSGGRKPGADGPLPRHQPPQLATLADTVPPGDDWLHEMKYDGYRALVAAAGDEVRVFTRNGKDWSEKFPGLVDAVKAADLGTALLDGELVVLDADGRPSFQALQQALDGSASGEAIVYYAFDLLTEGRRDLKTLPNIERKARLAALLPGDSPVLRYSDHVLGRGEALFEAMCEKGLEGVVSKRADAPYRNARTKNWLKVKCIRRQDFVIVGLSRSTAKGRPFASLLLGQYDGDRLVYRGKVGTGWTMDAMEALSAKMRPLERKTPPLDVPKGAAKGVVWLTPKLVAEIAFAELTPEGVTRHASFLGLRADKDAKDAGVETPVAAAAVAEDAAKPAEAVKISSADRIVFPDAGITKGELADYVRRAAPLMLPWAARRPISLVRCPQGRQKKCFFQKHDSGSFGEHVLAVPIVEKEGEKQDYLYVEDAAGLLQCVQMGTIEFHGWGAPVDDVERPDRLVIDLDPDEGLAFEDVKAAALEIRDHLKDTGLVSFPMLTGGKGVHVIAPLHPSADWTEVKDFASRFARAIASAEPERFTATMSKAKRKGRIFIDWLRNQRGSTAILPYSPRARSGASVAVPIAWNELKDHDSGADFTIKDFDKLQRRAGSAAMQGWGEAEQTLPEL